MKDAEATSVVAAESFGSAGLILVVEDDDDVRELFVTLLGHAGFATAETASGEEALEMARCDRPALVLLDIGLPDLNGYEVFGELRAELGPEVPIVFTSGQRVEALDRTAGLMLGADDYIVKPFDPGELVARVRRLVVRGEVHGASADRYGLTPREVEILRMLAEGKRPGDIARELYLSPKTVSNHMQRIFSKLGVHTQAQAVAKAFHEHLTA